MKNRIHRVISLNKSLKEYLNQALSAEDSWIDALFVHDATMLTIIKNKTKFWFVLNKSELIIETFRDLIIAFKNYENKLWG